VSNEVGDGNVDKAKNAVSVTLKLSVLVGVPFYRPAAGVQPRPLGEPLRWDCGSAVIVSEFTPITPLVIVSMTPSCSTLHRVSCQVRELRALRLYLPAGDHIAERLYIFTDTTACMHK